MMKLLLTTNGRLFKNEKGEYYTPIVYGYGFFKPYFEVFDQIKLVAHVGKIKNGDEKKMLRVDGPGLEIFEVDCPRGKIKYILSYAKIKKALKNVGKDCSAAILRIPDQLAFQVFNELKRSGIPVGAEINSNSYEFFAKGSVKTPLRVPLRFLWDYKQKKVCKEADACCYVTEKAIQKRYPPGKNAYSTYCSDVDIENYKGFQRMFGDLPLKEIKCVHIAGSVGNPAKGGREMIDAAVLLKQKGINMVCTFAGGGKLPDETLEKIKDNSLEVNLPGSLDKTELNNLLLQNDLFVFPSYREGLPRSVIEAMAAGLPCVATELDGIKELLPEDCLVKVKDAVGLAEKINELCDNPKLLEKMSADNLAKAQEFKKSALDKRRKDFFMNLKTFGK